ncbi:MAG: ABC transporter ATP-binding protein [Legionella sp.]|uniref:ABC transporter ATP-binding protein n=1 Tax=Legionella sp. TaxID=459 RepID=UPI0039E4CB45
MIKSIYAFLWPIIKPYRWWLVLMFQATVLTGFYFPMNNYAIKSIVDAFSEHDILQYSQLIVPITVFILAQIGLDLSWRIHDIAAWHAEPYVHRAIILNSYDYIQQHSYSYFQNHPSGIIISRLKGIIDGYESIFSSLCYVVGKSFLTVLICIFSLAFINTYIFLFMLFWGVLVSTLTIPMSFKLKRLAEVTADTKHEIMGNLSDNILNIFSLFYFSKRKQELRKTKAQITTNYIPALIRIKKYWFWFSLMGSILYWIMLISVFIFSIWLKQQNLITSGDFVFIIMISITVSFELWMFSSFMFDFMKEVGNFKAAFSILTVPHEKIDRADARSFNIQSPSIEFKDLAFAYPDGKNIFNDLSLLIPASQRVGIVGHSGAGKSTLVSLLLKNFLPTQGDILIDNRSMSQITCDSLRSQIALIPQDILLFHRTLSENIGYAKDNATIDEIRDAAKKAHIDDFIQSLPDGYNTLVGERGIKLSGGQRQRIAIARAILKSAPIIVLDEATSSLDTATEQEIQQSINDMLESSHTTVIAVAHRLSTIRHMDRIVVMDAGSIIEDGTFDQLMLIKDGYFKRLWETQINGMIL